MRTWIKLYTEILRDPKMYRLSDKEFRACINLFALSGQLDRDGRLGTAEDIAFHLRTDPETALSTLQSLESAGITCNESCNEEPVTCNIWGVKNWGKRQSRAGSNTPDAVRERVAKHRKNKAKRESDVTSLHPRYTENVTRVKRHVTPSESESESESEKKNTAPQPPAPSDPEVVTPPEPHPVKALAAVFEQAAGIKLPTPSGEKSKRMIGVLWWAPLREMVKLAAGQAPDLLRRAVSDMRRDGLTIQAPKSVVANFTSLHGASQAAPPSAFKDY